MPKFPNPTTLKMMKDCSTSEKLFANMSQICQDYLKAYPKPGRYRFLAVHTHQSQARTIIDYIQHPDTLSIQEMTRIVPKPQSESTEDSDFFEEAETKKAKATGAESPYARAKNILDMVSEGSLHKQLETALKITLTNMKSARTMSEKVMDDTHKPDPLLTEYEQAQHEALDVIFK